MNAGPVRPHRRALAAILLGLALSGCDSAGMDDLRAYVQTVKSRPHGPIKPLPEVKSYETFLYQAQALRDPFEPAPFSRSTRAAGGQGNDLQPDLNRPREPLEDFPLDTLRMVGTLARGTEHWALVRANDGTIHRIQPGNYLGQNFGRVGTISEQQIELTEIIPDGQGGWLERKAYLALSE